MASAQPAASADRHHHESQGVAIGKYRRLESIGKGSFAVVYKAIHPDDGSLLAIKTVQHAQLKGKLKQNLFSEIEIMRKITHPHVVALVDILESTNHIHLVMEFCQLGDLATFVKKRDKLAAHPVTSEMLRLYPNPPGAGFNEVIVRHFAKQLASALEFLRAKNLVHRDLKPQNLLLNPPRSWIVNERPENRPYEISKESLLPAAGLDSLPFLKIADFGFARHLPTTTMAETLCGSPLYMAPEILRYEKYDAKADLWSVGTVLYELMIGKPPFRAANHVDLLRKIERTMDKIKFPDELVISDDMQSVIRALLKKMPTERMSWEEFFQSAIVVGDIPGLAGRDKPQRKVSSESISSGTKKKPATSPGEDVDTERRLLSALEERDSDTEAHAGSSRQQTAAPKPSQGRVRRPSLLSHATAPTTQGLRPDAAVSPGPMERRKSVHPTEPSSLPSKEVDTLRKPEKSGRDARERAAQDVAFERDYVMVEKRAVEVNAFADELAASPHIQAPGARGSPPMQSGQAGRRGTISGTPASQAAQDRQMAMRPDQITQRRGSYDRKFSTPRNSAQSALAAALNMVNLRFNVPGIVGGKGPSPPKGYGPYPAFPASAPTQLQLGEISKPAHMDEDHKILSVMEESATRSDVVYGFAEVKYRQLIPITPSNENPLNIKRPGAADADDDDLTPDAVVGLSEEALVLYVKSLAILTNTINLAGNWWSQRRVAEGAVDLASWPRSSDGARATAAASGRINNVVQWARNRFNECIEKSDYVSKRLLDAQQRLPLHHHAHPAKVSSTHGHRRQDSEVSISSGVTAEKLMYDRALDMSKAAAVNELVNDDLPGCEVSYLTAVRLLEAVIEKDEDGTAKRGKREASENDNEPVEGIEDSDRRTVMKLIEHMKVRLAALRKKTAIQTASAKRDARKTRSLSQEAVTGTSPR